MICCPLLLHRAIPYIGDYVQRPFEEYLEKQKQHLHRKPGVTVAHVSNLPTSGPMVTFLQSLTPLPSPFVPLPSLSSTGLQLSADLVWLRSYGNGGVLCSVHCPLYGATPRQEIAPTGHGTKTQA